MTIVAFPAKQSPSFERETLPQRLAVALYYARAEFFALDQQGRVPSFEALNQIEQARWLLAATDWLADHAPEKCLAGCGNWAQIDSQWCSTSCRVATECS